MFVIFGLLFLFVKFILSKLQVNFTRCYSSLRIINCIESLADSVCSSLAPAFTSQLAHKFTTFASHSRGGQTAKLQENDGPPKDCHYPCQEVFTDLQSLSRAFRFSGNKSRPIDRVQTRWSIICSFLFDILAGVAFYIFVTNSISPNVLASYFIKWRDVTHRFLNELLDWLMGAPAGLKLNHEMAVFFGNFFLYHIYIWIGYLSIMEPFYITIINAIMVSSFLGLSVMLSLASDTFTFLTFHTYCFYVYAAKVYKLQLQGLVSLSRLMRGKKWNPLRTRVDSIPYDANQLAFGTIIFTILLFLLPTTGIYYLVFTLLRLPVIVLKSAIYCAVRALNTIPIHEILQKIFMLKEQIDDVSLDLCYGKRLSQSESEEPRNERRRDTTIHLSKDMDLVVRFHNISFQGLLERTEFGFKNLLSFNSLIKSLLFGDIMNSLNTG